VADALLYNALFDRVGQPGDWPSSCPKEKLTLSKGQQINSLVFFINRESELASNSGTSEILFYPG
jgi:hypothetical protein